VKVNAPTTVYVKWGKDYTPLYALLAVIAVVAVISVCARSLTIGEKHRLGVSESFCMVRIYLRAFYSRITGSYMFNRFFAIFFSSRKDLYIDFEKWFLKNGWTITRLRGIVLAESELFYPTALLISSLITLTLVLLLLLGRTIDVGVITLFALLATLTLYSLRPLIALFKANGLYVLLANAVCYNSAIAFIKEHGGEIREEKIVTIQGTPLHKYIATLPTPPPPPPPPLQPPEETPVVPTPPETSTAPKEPEETLKAKPPEQLASTPQATPRRILRDGVEYYDFSGATLKGYTMGSKTHPRKEGQVEVGEFLGRGGYSIVYKGYIGGKPVAVKVCGRVERIDDGYYFSPPSKKGEIMDFFNQILTLGLIKRRMVLRQPNEEYLRELIEASVQLRNFNVSSPDELIGKYPVREWLSDLASYHHNIAMVKLFNAPFFEKFQRSSLDESIYSSTEEFAESPPFFAMQLADADLSKLPEMYGGSSEFPSILTAAFCQATAAISLVYACSTIPGEGSGEVFHPPRIHKDIKPGNILFKRHKQGFRFVVTDFGLAETQKRREKRWQIGTPYYMPPEYLLYPYESVLPSFDVYSLGATVLSLIARYDAPYLLIATTQHEFLQRYREDALRRLKELYRDRAESMVEEAGRIVYSTDDPFQLDEEAKRSRLTLLQERVKEWGLYPLNIDDRIDGRVKGLLQDMVNMDYERRPKSILEVYFRLRALLGDSFTKYAPKKKEKISVS
jgi:serine/threonine protein kinase